MLKYLSFLRGETVYKRYFASPGIRICMSTANAEISESRND